MSTDWGFVIFFSLLALVLGFWFGFVAGAGGAYNSAKDSAVESGHAEYYLDDKHQRQFRWKDHGK